MRMAIVMALASVAAAGCTTIGPIPADDSMVIVDASAPSIPNINRTRRWDGQDLVEEWDWNTGQLYIVRLDRTKYYPTNFRSAAELIEEAETWPTLERGQTRFNPRNVETSSNRIGEFVYAVSEVDSRGDRCFLMLQGLPASGGAGFEPIPSGSSSQGYLSFYDCRAAATMSADKLEDLMLTFAESLSHVHR